MKVGTIQNICNLCEKILSFKKNILFKKKKEKKKRIIYNFYIFHYLQIKYKVNFMCMVLDNVIWLLKQTGFLSKGQSREADFEFA